MNPHPKKNKTYYSRTYFPGHGESHHATLAEEVKSVEGTLRFLQAMEDGSHRLVKVLPACKTEIYRIDYPADGHI